jgi:hypothetical protein
MARLIKIEKEELQDFAHQNLKTKYCKELEDGNILFFPTCPFEFPKNELDFLLAQKQTGAKNRKNIAYKPQADKITNFEKSSVEHEEYFRSIMRNFSNRSVQFLSMLLEPYQNSWHLDYASFRPFQEKGRPLRLRARNDLLHVDSFPTRPMHGNRILRFFININPIESRKWITTSPFEILAKQFGGSDQMPFPKGVDESILGTLLRKTKKWVNQSGIPISLASPYDQFMLGLHNFLKENSDFQQNCPKDFWEFPPLSCWAVYTDLVSHAAISGQYALEQTIIIPKEALVQPEKAPVSILENLTGKKMTDPLFSS